MSWFPKYGLIFITRKIPRHKSIYFLITLKISNIAYFSLYFKYIIFYYYENIYFIFYSAFWCSLLNNNICKLIVSAYCEVQQIIIWYFKCTFIDIFWAKNKP